MLSSGEYSIGLGINMMHCIICRKISISIHFNGIVVFVSYYYCSYNVMH